MYEKIRTVTTGKLFSQRSKAIENIPPLQECTSSPHSTSACQAFVWGQLVNLLRQISLTFWVEANEALNLVVLICLMNNEMEVTFLLPVKISTDFLNAIWKVSCDIMVHDRKKYPHSTQSRWGKCARGYPETRSISNVNAAYAYGKTQMWSLTF